MERGDDLKPSEQMLTALTCGLRLTLNDRDYLFHVVGYDPQQGMCHTGHVDLGLMRVVGRLTDTPIIVMDSLGEILFQAQPGS